MSFLNKIFKNKLTGDTFTIIDQYQNVAITSTKEKINTTLLENDKIFMEVPKSNPTNIIQENYKPKIEEIVDPNKFFNNQSTYNTFAEKIKSIDTSKFNDEPVQSFSNIPNDNSNNINYRSNFGSIPVTNESAIIMSDPEDEIEELKRKYGATTVSDSLKRQNETFSKILNPEEPEQIQRIEARPEIQEYTPQNDQIVQQKNESIQVPQPQSQSNPVFELFKNVKRNTDFKISVDINGKIPRLDFIEMMEDSYEHSIIEYLATEFTNNLLSDPESIKSQVMNHIRKMIDQKDNNFKTQKVEKHEALEFVKEPVLSQDPPKKIQRKPKTTSRREKKIETK